ncbi:MAG: PIN domain-containing protein [Aggregatilineales bacterium]
MPIELRATIIDIRADAPRPSDVFLVDTNVLYWMCYSRARNPASARRQRADAYSDYIKKARQAQSTLQLCVASLAELAHAIERDECEIYNQGLGASLSLKTYRRQKRDDVVEQVRSAWQLAESITNGRVLPAAPVVSKLYDTLASAAVDGYDLLIYHAALSAGIRQILTDDADYGEFADVQIFTANDSLIDLARAQNKLLRR